MPLESSYLQSYAPWCCKKINKCARYISASEQYWYCKKDANAYEIVYKILRFFWVECNGDYEQGSLLAVFLLATQFCDHCPTLTCNQNKKEISRSARQNHKAAREGNKQGGKRRHTHFLFPSPFILAGLNPFAGVESYSSRTSTYPARKPVGHRCRSLATAVKDLNES